MAGPGGRGLPVTFSTKTRPDAASLTTGSSWPGLHHQGPRLLQAATHRECYSPSITAAVAISVEKAARPGWEQMVDEEEAGL
ncbi:hypothetical protein CPLU01_09330 [Colletotrichum plurivorum]|uniref:Uncharacterized protein n=1 Tax=Colletotrichum plurivorum TaxID=2175906 RepID=A0A8H6KAD7_9PEZI|nr:hypothetical protein CPLU01_09330 [Colletotrichum plurivorum]